MHDFKKLKVWEKAMDLTVDVYKATSSFPTEERYGLTSQMRRCSVSVPSNISEGAGRNNRGEFRHFLGIANGSSFELTTQTILANRLGLLGDNPCNEILEQLEEIQKMTYALILKM